MNPCQRRSGVIDDISFHTNLKLPIHDDVRAQWKKTMNVDQKYQQIAYRYLLVPGI
jgi:hypothetical protein